MHATRGSGTRAGSLTTPTVLLVLVVVGCQVAVMADVFLVDIPNTKLVVGLPLSSTKRANPDVLLPLLRDHAWLLEASDSAPVVAPVNEETNDAKPEVPQEETTTAAPTRPPTRPPADGSHPLAKAALVVLCYNRPQLLQDAIDHLRQADDFDTIKKYISQDGSERQTREVAQGYRSTFEYLTHPRTLPARIKLNTTDPDRQVKDTPGTMYLTAHYKWVLDKLLIEKNHSHAIIVEDDLMVSVDFIRMFAATVPLLDADPSLWCVSSWNDNGFPDFDLPKGAFFRSSFFPGLGWMLKRDTWLELSPKFPDDNWDHWMRVSTTHRGRSCLVPFLSRNRNAGETGATSNTDFYETYLKRVVTLTKEAATPRPKFITAGLLEADYDKELSKALGAAQVISQAEVYLSPTLFQSGKSYLVPYRSSEFGQSLSQSLHIHPTPRTQYKGVTWLQYNKAHLFLVDMRLSELAPFSLRELADSSLHAVRARAPNVNCITVCQQFGASVREEGWTCDENQFDYINDCQVLASQFDGCPTGCTQGWGEDIPNMETWEVGTDRPQCLVTEMTPTCAASHRLTTRLCPCVKRSEGNPPMPVVPADKLSFVGTRRVGENCFEACADYRRSPEMNPTHRCDDRQMTFANSCSSLKQRFGCLTCERSANAKAAPSASEDKTVCYLPVLHAGDCARFDAAEWRLCSCVPI